ncbi:hypothetical protein [Microbacterium hominis]|uniref:GGDEF domain-containing protein n=1 Tax=Microbacterium hominis TaxID=162426 RepID=A0A7D4QCV7_9MICO|nr:hypothetical protein [Microbacterium hominis]QKJ19617.1 hypothetical protein HQM25_09750 [Microbacterium hominis]
MNLDVASVMVMSALVVNVSGILFITETLLRRDEGAGRVWSIAFLAAMLTTLAYTVWAQDAGAWWAVAVGNAAFVAGTGTMWLGAHKYNARPMRWSVVAVIAASLAAGAAVLAEGPGGGDWAGVLWMFVPLIVFAALGAYECIVGAMRESRTAWVLGAVLALQSGWYIARTTALLVGGVDSALFLDSFGTIPTSFLTVVLTIVGVVVLSVLRAARAPMRGYLNAGQSGSVRGGILDADVIAFALEGLCDRAEQRREMIAVIAVRIEDLDQISTAFGSETAQSVAETWRAGVRRHAPSNALVGEDGLVGLLVGTLVDSATIAQRQAGRIYRELFDDLGEVAGGVIPVVGVGVALSDTAGYDANVLIRLAGDAADRAMASVESSVLIADGR